MNELKTVNQPLHQMMTSGQPYRDARELVAILRNTIHHESLRTIMWQSGGSRRERVVIPRATEADLEEVLAHIGSAADFGVTREADHRLYIEPEIYFEQILAPVLGAVNAVMDATPVETLHGVDPAKFLTAPPGDDTFNAAKRRRIRLLSGIP
jgi:hypothetical protein